MRFAGLLIVTGCLGLASMAGDAAAQGNSAIVGGEIIITEFFETLMRVNATSGGKSTMNRGAFEPQDILAIDSTRQIVAIDSADRLVRFNPTSLAVTPLTSTLFPGAVDIALETSGTILVANRDDVFRVNPTSGATSTLVSHLNVNGGFFSPNGIAVGPTGRIFVTEFYEQLWEINAATGAAAVIPLSEEATLASMIDVRSDGDLILRDFDVPQLLRINPNTGGVTTFATDLPSLTFDLDLEADNDVVITSSEGLFRYSAANGSPTPLTIDASFFSPAAIAIAPQDAAPQFAAADFNRDGLVNAIDLSAWRAGFGRATNSTHMHGNADADGDVDGADFLVWQRQVGGNAANQSVPEPSTWSLAMTLAAVAVGAGRSFKSAAKVTG